MPRRFRLPLAQWPEPDRLAWQRAITPLDYFDTLAPAGHWSTKTKYQAEAAYGRWLAFLHMNEPDALLLSPAVRDNPARLHRYVEALTHRLRPMSIAAELGHLVLMLRILAPDVDWSWLRALQYRYEKRAVPREKRNKIVHPGRLFDLGLALMDRADAVSQEAARARQYRDGLLIALLIARPIRRRSLSQLTVHRNLRRVQDYYVLILEAEDTKSRSGTGFPLPQLLTPYLERYVDHYRLLFPRARELEALWLSAKGCALGAEAIYDCICRRTEEAFGWSIHPHLFRDIAATAIARDMPQALAVASDLLTHVNVETTLRHYSHASTLDASRRYSAVLEGVRATSKPSKLRPNDPAAKMPAAAGG